MNLRALRDNHYVVIDVELTSVHQTAQLLSVGAVVLTHDAGILPKRFYMPIEHRVDDRFAESTVDVREFWMKLGRDESLAVNVFGDYRAKPLRDVLEAFNLFLDSFSTYENRYVVGKGTRIDGGTLANAYEVEGMELPFFFRNESCLRALNDQASILDIDMPSSIINPIPHHALFDAYVEAQQFLYLSNEIMRLGNEAKVSKWIEKDIMSEKWVQDEIAFLESL